MKVAVVGGGIAGLAAARALESLLPEAEVTLVEKARLGGKLVTEREDGFVVEGAADSFLSRKPRGVGLAEELGVELVGRRQENARSFVRLGGELHRLPEGLTGMIPTNLDALDATGLLTPEGRARLAAEPDTLPAPPGADESIASFVRRRLGDEAYERLVEPLMTGIYGGDGEQLSLQATFPNLRALELEHGSVLRGLGAQPAPPASLPPFVSPRGGMGELVDAVVAGLRRTRVVTSTTTRISAGYRVDTEAETIEADAVILAVPAFAVAEVLAELDPELAQAHAEIPYASSTVVTLAYREEDAPFAGYGYVVPSAEGTDVLAATWSTNKWEGRAPAGVALVRVYLGRFGGRDVTADTDDDLVEHARNELRSTGVTAEPLRTWIHRWPHGMPQYVLGHPERLERIDAALERHPGLALAGAAYRGVGIPDCIASGEEAARAVARSLAGAPDVRHTESQRLFAEAARLMPGGVSSPVRAFKAVGGDPLFVERGEGAYLVDADGNRYVDYVLSWGPLILGHAHPRVVAALEEAVRRGTSYGAPSALELELARLIRDALPSVELVRFVSSGTEATMSALRLARAFTGREKIVKLAGCYHGHADFLLVQAGSGVATLGLPDSPGVTRGAAADTLVAPFNDVAAVERLLAEHEVAAVIVEPVAGNMGLVPPLDGYLQRLRAATAAAGALLVFDEVMTGFRVHPGGAQALYGVRPDLTTLGKVVGGGLPVGAYGGRRELMELVAPAGPVYQAGTLSGNPLAMTAGIETLRALAEPGVWDGLERAGERLLSGLAALDAPVQLARVGTMWGLFFADAPVRSWDDAKQADTERFARFHRAMLDRGVYLAPSQFEAGSLSTAHGDAEIDATIEAARAAFAAIL